MKKCAEIVSILVLGFSLTHCGLKLKDGGSDSTYNPTPTPTPPGGSQTSGICPAGYAGANTYYQGDGSAANPYVICVISDLYLIQSNIHGDLSKNFILGQDIDIGVLASSIGTATSPFTGSFDGKSHSLKNITLNKSGLDNVGLFGVVGSESSSASRASIKNLNVTVNSITGNDNVGGIVGHAVNADLDQLTVGPGVQATPEPGVFGAHYVGGLVGTLGNEPETIGATLSNSSSTLRVGLATCVSGCGQLGNLIGSIGTKSSVSNSNATGKVEAEYYFTSTLASFNVGGLVGRSAGKVISSHAVSNVKGTFHVGGLVGAMVAGSIIDKSSVTAVSITGNGDVVGGLVGYSEGAITNSFVQSNDYTVSNSNVTSTLQHSNPLIRLGGLVGLLKATGRIYNSYSKVVFSAPKQGAYAGGLAGFMESGSKINHSYSASKISWNYFGADCEGIPCYNPHGLAGWPAPESDGILNSFFDRDAAPSARDGISAPWNPTWARAESDMKLAGIYTAAGWDFTNVWNWDVTGKQNDRFPFLVGNLP